MHVAAMTRIVPVQDVTSANAEGNVPLHWACLNGHVEVSCGTLYWARCFASKVPKHTWTSAEGCLVRVQIVRLLMEAGASPSALNRYRLAMPLDSLCYGMYSSRSKGVRWESMTASCARHSHERTPIDEALNHMRCDDILAVINAHTSSGGGGGTQGEGSFDFDDAAENEGGSGFPQKPQ